MKTAHVTTAVKKDNPLYFAKGTDNMFGVVRRDFKSLEDGRIFMIEHQVLEDIEKDEYTLRRITVEEDNTYKVNLPRRFDTRREVLDHLINLEAQSNPEAF